MAKPDDELPTGTKALQKMVEDLRTDLSREQADAAAAEVRYAAEIDALKTEHEEIRANLLQQAADAKEGAERARASVEEMGRNRDAWVGRVDKATLALRYALAALEGPVETTEPDAPTEDPEDAPTPE